MNHYYITKEDLLYGNCLYMATNHPSKVRFNDEDCTITIKDDITWYLTKELYGNVRSCIDDINEYNVADITLFHKR